MFYLRVNNEYKSMVLTIFKWSKHTRMQMHIWYVWFILWVFLIHALCKLLASSWNEMNKLQKTFLHHHSRVKSVTHDTSSRVSKLIREYLQRVWYNLKVRNILCYLPEGLYMSLYVYHIKSAIKFCEKIVLGYAHKEKKNT